MFVFAKRESKEEHVARKQQKIQIGVDFLGIWEFMICCAGGSARPARTRIYQTCQDPDPPDMPNYP